VGWRSASTKRAGNAVALSALPNRCGSSMPWRSRRCGVTYLHVCHAAMRGMLRAARRRGSNVGRRFGHRERVVIMRFEAGCSRSRCRRWSWRIGASWWPAIRRCVADHGCGRRLAQDQPAGLGGAVFLVR
jgi:hypothetical protein